MARVSAEQANELSIACRHGHPANWRDDSYTPTRVNRGEGVHKICRDCESDKARRLNYGLPKGTYANLVAAQEGKCAICKNVAKLAVDHNHETGKARGLLCHSCNLAVGAYESAKRRDIEAYLEVYDA